MAQMTDAEQAQRQAQLLALLGPIHDRGRRTARRLCACAADGDDLFHEAVLKAFDKLPTLRDPARFPGWFYAVLLSVHRSRSRRSFWRRFLPLQEPSSKDGSSRQPLEPMQPPALAEEQRERAQRLTRALAALPADQREALVLFEVEGFSLEEIAAMQQASVTAVKTRLHRGRQRLRRHYEGLGDELDAEPGPPAKEICHGHG